MERTMGPLGPRSGWGERLRVFLPSLLLALVALRQVHLTRVTELTPWKGGGFGMFSSADGLSERRLRIVVRAPERAEEIGVPEGLAKLAAKAAVLPDPARLDRLARAIVGAERAAGRSAESVEVAVLGTTYASKTLFASERTLAHHALRVAVPAEDAARTE
jgi:hypothetical protein